MPLRVKSQGTVFKGDEESRHQSALYPGVCVLPCGRRVVTFRAASFREATTGQRVLMMFSDDKGLSWSEPYDFFKDVPMVENRRGEFFIMYITPLGGKKALGTLLWIDSSKPERPYYNPATHGILDHRIFFTFSDDNCQSWSEPRLLEGMLHTRPTAVTSPTLLLPNGKLACQFEVHKHYDEEGPKFFEGAMAFSSDGGKTWGDYSVVSYDPEMRMCWWDQRINTVGEKLLGLFWTYDDLKSCYLNIYAAQSLDYGLTWGEHYDTGVPGQPSQPVMMNDGSIAMAYVDRTASPAIRVRQSFDGGMTWPGNTEVTVYESGLEKQVKNKTDINDMWVEIYRFSVGFPVVARLPDGDLLVCYYMGPDTDHTAINYAVLGS